MFVTQGQLCCFYRTTPHAMLCCAGVLCCLCCAGASDVLHTVGLLVVDSTVPGSPADGVLEPGDVLVRVQGEVVSHFLQLEELLDAAVSHTVELQLERGGKPLTVLLPVTNLHDVTPATMLELAGGSVHALSYQQARNNRYTVTCVDIVRVSACVVSETSCLRRITSCRASSSCMWGE